MSPGHRWTVRGTVHLIMVEGSVHRKQRLPREPPESVAKYPSTTLRVVPFPGKCRGGFLRSPQYLFRDPVGAFVVDVDGEPAVFGDQSADLDSEAPREVAEHAVQGDEA